MVQILEALVGLHNIGVIHMDVKPGNLLIDDEDNIKVIDFDFSIITMGSENKPRKLTGTAEYLPPERENLEFGIAATSTDIYSAGITFIEIITGVRSRSAKDCGKYTELINWMICEDPDSRPSAKTCLILIKSL